MTSKRHTFRAVAIRWLNESAGSVSEKTIEHYRWVLERFVFPNIGESLEISKEEVDSLVTAKRAEGLSESTIYEIPRIIWRILSFASAEGLCEAPGWTADPSTPKKKGATVILSPSEEQRLIKYLSDNPSPKNLGLFLILTEGLSPKEALALKWEDISLHKNEMRVLTEEETTPDTRNKYRILPINERLKIYLKKLSSLPTVHLVSERPKPLTLSSFRGHFIKTLKDLGLREMPLYDLRRTFAVRCLEGGMDYEKLSKILGQANSRSFRSFYRELVSPETRARLENDLLASRTIRKAPATIRPAEKDPEIKRLEKKIEAKKRELKETLDNLDGDLKIIQTLRNSDLPSPGPREGLYRLIEKLLGNDRDEEMLVEYLRSNMRIASMPSRKTLSAQTIRRRVTRGFEKLAAILEVPESN